MSYASTCHCRWMDTGGAKGDKDGGQQTRKLERENFEKLPRMA